MTATRYGRPLRERCERRHGLRGKMAECNRPKSETAGGGVANNNEATLPCPPSSLRGGVELCCKLSSFLAPLRGFDRDVRRCTFVPQPDRTWIPSKSNAGMQEVIGSEETVRRAYVTNFTYIRSTPTYNLESKLIPQPGYVSYSLSQCMQTRFHRIIKLKKVSYGLGHLSLPLADPSQSSGL